jgi:hypothetical protein
VWLLSDDDELVLGAIEKVLSVVSRHPEVAAVFVNFRHVLSLRTDKDRLCRNGEEFFYLSHFGCGLVSSNVINTEIWRELDLSRHFGSGWIHLAYLLSDRPTYLIAHRYLIEGNKDRKWGKRGRSCVPA